MLAGGPGPGEQAQEEQAVGADGPVCRDWVVGACAREPCRYAHERPTPAERRALLHFCHDFQNKGCFRKSCKFVHCSADAEQAFYDTGALPHEFPHGPPPPRPQLSVRPRSRPPAFLPRLEDGPSDAKLLRFTPGAELRLPAEPPRCAACDSSDHTIRLLHDNISVLLKKVADLNRKNAQLTSMNEFLLEQTASLRGDQPCVITSRHGTSAPVSLATVSVTPVVSLAGTLPTLVPTAAPASIALTPAALSAATSRGQILTQAPQLLTVSTAQQLMGSSAALIVTSTGAHQLMQASTQATLVGGGQAVVAVAPAQLMGNASQATVQLVQQSAQQLAQQSAQQLAAAQQSAQQLAVAQQSVQLAAAQQSAQLAAAQQSAQQLAAAAQQSAHQLAAAQQSAQQLAAAQQSAQQQLVQSTQQLVHHSSAQISNSNQPNTQAPPMTFPIISQSILPH